MVGGVVVVGMVAILHQKIESIRTMQWIEHQNTAMDRAPEHCNRALEHRNRALEHRNRQGTRTPQWIEHQNTAMDRAPEHRNG